MDRGQNFRICVSSPPEFDTLSQLLFSHWCGGKSVSQMLNMSSMKSFYNSMDEEHPLEFPKLRYRGDDSAAGSSGSYSGDSSILNLCSANTYTSNVRLLLTSCRVRDDYMMFQSLEHYLQEPLLLEKQTVSLQVPADKQSFFVENYWSLDDAVVREILGNKRLTSRSRKDLDEMSTYSIILFLLSTLSLSLNQTFLLSILFHRRMTRHDDTT
jgi:hypothetical protein